MRCLCCFAWKGRPAVSLFQRKKKKNGRLSTALMCSKKKKINIGGWEGDACGFLTRHPRGKHRTHRNWPSRADCATNTLGIELRHLERYCAVVEMVVAVVVVVVVKRVTRKQYQGPEPLFKKQNNKQKKKKKKKKKKKTERRNENRWHLHTPCRLCVASIADKRFRRVLKGADLTSPRRGVANRDRFIEGLSGVWRRT